MNKRLKAFVIYISSILLLFVAAYYIIPVSFPIILAAITALMLEGIVQYVIKNFHLSRRLSIAILHGLFFCLCLLITYFTITILLKQLISLSKTLPEHFNTLYTLYIELQTKVFNWTNDWPIEVVQMLQVNLQQQLTYLIGFLTQLTAWERYSTIALATPNILLSLFVYFSVLYLIQLELPSLIERFLKSLKPEIAKKIIHISKELKIAVWGFFKAQILVSIIIAVTALPALYFILPGYALLLTVALTFVDAIPFLDSFFLLAPLAFIFFLSGQNHLALSILVLGIILMLIRRFLEPKLLGTHINLPTLPTFIAMFIGLKLFGVFGLLAGPVVVVFIRSLFKQKVIPF